MQENINRILEFENPINGEHFYIQILSIDEGEQGYDYDLNMEGLPSIDPFIDNVKVTNEKGEDVTQKCAETVLKGYRAKAFGNITLLDAIFDYVNSCIALV